MAYPGGQNLEEVRTVDPIWTRWVQGFGHAMFVGEVLFPRAPVRSRSGKVVQFLRDSFRLSSTRRAPGSTLRTRQFTHGSVTYKLEDHGEMLVIPQEDIEEGAFQPGTDLVADNMGQFMQTQWLRHEKDCADLAVTASNYPAAHQITPSTKWDAANATPVADIRTGHDLIMNAIGQRANTLLLGQAAYNAAVDSDEITDRVKYTSGESIGLDVLARLFEVDRVVKAEAVYDDAGGTTTALWTTDSAILAYVDPGMPLPEPANAPNEQRGHGGSVTGRGQSLYSRRKPSYGYTYEVTGYPIITGEFYKETRNSWVYPFLWPRKPFRTFVDSNDDNIAGVIFLSVDT